MAAASFLFNGLRTQLGKDIFGSSGTWAVTSISATLNLTPPLAPTLRLIQPFGPNCLALTIATGAGNVEQPDYQKGWRQILDGPLLGVQQLMLSSAGWTEEILIVVSHVQNVLGISLVHLAQVRYVRAEF